MTTTLGAFVRAERERQNYTQTSFAEAIDLDRAYVSQIESGRVALPNAETRRRMARVLGLRHIDLLVAAGELAPDEVPGPTPPVRNPNDPVERLCDLLHRVDLTVDRRAIGLERTLQMFLDQDRADGLVTEMVGFESRASGQ